MGTDIHPIIQVRAADGAWQYVGQGPLGTPWGTYTSPILRYRDYDLFAILAGVRNGRGFAGCLLATPVVPIAEPRGLPEDLGAVPLDEGEPFYFGDHSHSWVTLREVEQFPWDEPRVFYGVIPVEEYEAFLKASNDRSKPPEEYCGGIDGHGIVTLEEPEYLALRAKDALPTTTIDEYGPHAGQRVPIKKLYLRVSWTQPHRDSCKDFHDTFIPWLQKLAADNHLDHDDVRIVFGFDS